MRAPKRFLRKHSRKTVRMLKRFLRACYEAGLSTCLFVGGVFVFLIVGIILIFTIPKTREASLEKEIAGMALISPTPAPDEAEGDGVPPAELGAPDDETAIPALEEIPDGGGTAIEPEAAATPEVRLEKGDKTEDVAQLQERLMALGYLAIDEPTQYYGDATKYAVKLFQRQHDLKQDGIAGNETQDLLFSTEAKPYVMYEGAEGDDIKDFQEMLYDLGYLSSKQITGYYGTATSEAVKKFQNRNHLSKDGKAGEQTIETINSADARVSYTKELEIKAAKKKAEEAAKAQSVEGRIEKMIDIAKDQLGKPYVLGAKGPKSYDCSGLVYYCLTKVDVYTRRLNASGFSRTNAWKKITDIDDLKRGDLIFFNFGSSSSVGHVGIYVGSGEMIDASSANGKVVRRSAKSSYWKKHFVCGRRPIT